MRSKMQMKLLKATQINNAEIQNTNQGHILGLIPLINKLWIAYRKCVICIEEKRFFFNSSIVDELFSYSVIVYKYVTVNRKWKDNLQSEVYWKSPEPFLHRYRRMP